MEIKHKEQGQKGSFYIEMNEKIVGEMTYVWSGEQRIIVDHTEVGEELKGQGAGKLMLAELVAFAREKKIKVMPLCPFVKAAFDKSNEYDDIKF